MSTTETLAARVEILCGDLSQIRAPHGTELNARQWSTEAPLRMLLNNLDGEVAERPEDLVVYGGSGRAARSHVALKREHGISALDIAKRLMDYGFHPPTVYFPLVVAEALMIEPTESEAKETLDAFCDAMLAIVREAAEEPETIRDAPHNRPVRRLDEVRAAKQPVVKHAFEGVPQHTAST